MAETKFTNLTVGEIRSIIELDMREIMCGINVFKYLEVGDHILSFPEFELGMNVGPLREAVNQMAINVDKVVRDYLTYDPRVIPDPLEFYKWIVSKRGEIEEVLRTDMSEPLGDAPIKYDILSRILHWFGLLWKHLVGVGSVHKFNEEFVRQRLYGDQIRPDEE